MPHQPQAEADRYTLQHNKFLAVFDSDNDSNEDDMNDSSSAGVLIMGSYAR